MVLIHLICEYNPFIRITTKLLTSYPWCVLKLSLTDDVFAIFLIKILIIREVFARKLYQIFFRLECLD